MPYARRSCLLVLGLALAGGWLCRPATAADYEDWTSQAQHYRGNTPVAATPDGNLLVEAEEFHVQHTGGAGTETWRPKNWGENYYFATFANTFMSRKGFLGAPAQCPPTEASIEVDVPKAGHYLALVRYEAAYRFETQFRLKVEQGGQVKLDRLYGARKNLKVWAFNGAPVPDARWASRLRDEVAWPWGAVENVVWEGTDNYVDLQPGKAKLTLTTGPQPDPGARRNVDCILLTTDAAQVHHRIASEGYLPLDGMLTQAGDVYLRVQNRGKYETTVTVPPGVQHSSYWVHERDWKPVDIAVAPGKTSEWIEVGSLLDSLNDGAWNLTAKLTNPAPGSAARAASDRHKPSEYLDYHVDIAVKSAAGKIEKVRGFDSHDDALTLAYDANTRYTHRVRPIQEVLYDLLTYLKKHPVPGKPPVLTPVYAYTFDAIPGDGAYEQKRREFMAMEGLTLTVNAADAPAPASGRVVGYADVRGDAKEVEKGLLEITAHGNAASIRTVSLGDEIGLVEPQPDCHAAFRAWARARGLKPSDIDPAAGDDWQKVNYPELPPWGPEREAWAHAHAGLYYYSRLYAGDFGIAHLKEETDLVKKYLPNADAGANYSPHGGAPYLGSATQYISVFRQGGMTMPWGEDYAWQVPVGSQQMNFIQVDLFRAGNRYHPERSTQMYVMPHWPGNTPESWRRLFYGDLGSGVRIINLFEFRPVQVAYTENHVSLPRMFNEVRRGLYELAGFEDIVQSGQVRAGSVALWYSRAGDIWNDQQAPFGAGKRTLYVAIRQQQAALDIVDEEDALKGTLAGYKVLYLTDRHVSRVASKAIAEWVAKGGRLFATAGAGMRDEFDQPNTAMEELLGVKETALEVAPGQAVGLEKQDLPFTKAVARVRWTEQPTFKVTIDAYGAVSHIQSWTPVRKGDWGAEAYFSDMSLAAVGNRTGHGQTLYCAFLPGLSYFKSAIPLRPVDRASTPDAMAHFIPTDFDAGASELIAWPLRSPQQVPQPVVCSERLVQASVIDSPQGVAIPLVNWSAGPVRALQVTLHGEFPKHATLAGGGKVLDTTHDGVRVLTFDLDVADAIVLR